MFFVFKSIINHNNILQTIKTLNCSEPSTFQILKRCWPFSLYENRYLPNSSKTIRIFTNGKKKRKEKCISSRYNFGRSKQLVFIVIEEHKSTPRTRLAHEEPEFEDARPVRIRDLSGFEKMTFFSSSQPSSIFFNGTRILHYIAIHHPTFSPRQ